ncbi:MAG: ATP-binding domain-containing protein [Candidatus Zixiibacteriota bacterium]
MAQVFPPRLTDAFSGSQSSGEKIVYDKACTELAGNYHVFHDVRWDDPQLEDSKTAGQIDFVVFHPERGIICLEVKGGRCSYQAEDRTWHTTDRHGSRIEIVDPFEQARSAARVIVKLLHQAPPAQNVYIPCASAVLFPDCTFPKRKIRADIQGWQILDQDSLYDFTGSLDALFQSAFPERKMDVQQSAAILNGLRRLYGTENLEGRLSLNQRIRFAEERLIALTEQQVQILEALRLQKRLLVQGCAGSGKTLLAMHRAKTLAESGHTVLLASYNIPLGQHLAQQCAEYEGITAGPLLELIVTWLTEAGCLKQLGEGDRWWSEELPTIAADHLDSLPSLFDAIVIDEGQDFREAHWTLIELLLKNPESDPLYVFSDHGQNIYQGTEQYPMRLSPVILDRNVRSTDQIYAVVKASCPTDAMRASSGVSGPVPRLLAYDDPASMLQVIEDVLGQLIGEGVPISDIVLLGTKSQARTGLTYGTKIGPFTLDPEGRKPRTLRAMTIHRFKGLESPVVILCELEEGLRNLQELVHIGASRASVGLFVLAERSTIPALEAYGLSPTRPATG